MLGQVKSKIYSLGLLLGKLKYNNKQSKVLYYHDVHEGIDTAETPMSTPMSLFWEHVKAIKAQGFKIVDEITQPRQQIMITFDDGFRGLYKNKDFFLMQGIKPTVFLISDKIGTDTFMSKREILELQQHGFRFQSHTHTHPDLNTLTVKQLEEEFLTSKTLLEKLLSKKVDEICFPKGLFNKEVLKTAIACGYKKLYASIPGSYYEDNEFGVIQRNLVQHTGAADFVSVLNGGSEIYKKRYVKQHYSE